MVPRTFVTPIAIALLARPAKAVLRLNAHSMLHVVRGILGTLTAISLLSVRSAIAHRFNRRAGTIFTIVSLTQFHLPFYASRTLPNVFALILTNFALAARIDGTRRLRSVVLLSIACALLRSELALYLFPTIVMVSDLRSRVFVSACGVAFCSALVSALVSIGVDSYFWQRICYPELEVFYFNVVLNKSSEWGTSPPHWYFSNALPRALGGSYVLLFVYLIQFGGVLLPIAFPALFFITLYSVLPHKELRFIFYVLPVLNYVVAVGASATLIDVRRAWATAVSLREASKRSRGWAGRLWRFVPACCMLVLLLASVLGSMVQTVISTAASRHNYASAHALRRLHVGEEKLYGTNESLCSARGARGAVDGVNMETVAHVYIDRASAMNGISQFVYRDGDGGDDGGWRCPVWTYSKDESVRDGELQRFTHVVSERDRIDGFCVVVRERGFVRLDWRNGRLVLEDRMFAHRNLKVSAERCL